MGQFKPMVKMMTTEPTVELKLKKGGAVKMQAGGLSGMGAMTAQAPMMPARGGMAATKAPMRPSMAARRRAMMAMPAAAAPAAPVGMAGRMMKEGGESKAGHAAEMKKMAKTAAALKEHAGKPASKAHKGLKTGGVVMGQGGYKAGGIIKSEKGDTMMHTSKAEQSSAKTEGVKLGNAGGYKTGGVAKANAGGYKKGGAAKMMDGGMAYMKGGAAKKAYATGGVVESGAPVAMPQGRKKPSAPVLINQYAGTFKKGGKVTTAEGSLRNNFKKENATAVKQSKAYSNEVYSKYGRKMKGGGTASEAEKDVSKGAYDDARRHSMELEEALNPLSMIKELYGKARNAMKGQGAVSDKERSMIPSGSVTKTEKSVTVAPSKKRGGTVC